MIMSVEGLDPVSQTKCWVESIVIAFNLCPFAKREFDRDRIFYKVVTNLNINLKNSNDNISIIENALEYFINECLRLDNTPEIETSFLIFENNFTGFNSFLDLVNLANDLLVSQNYQGIYQIASFHPDYCFANTAQADASNYTNRSPYPMLHLLRESSITQAVQHYSESDLIPVRNIELTRKLGNSVLQNILQDCRKL